MSGENDTTKDYREYTTAAVHQAGPGDYPDGKTMGSKAFQGGGGRPGNLLLPVPSNHILNERRVRAIEEAARCKAAVEFLNSECPNGAAMIEGIANLRALGYPV